MPPLRPVSRLLSRLSVGRKLMLIYLLDLTAVIYVSGILLNEKYIAIDFARKEIAGNAYVAQLRDAMTEATHDALALAPQRDPAGLRRQVEALVAAEARHGAGMRSADESAAYQQALRAQEDVPAGRRAAAAEAALAAGRALLTRVGNQSNLILDPDLDSYYTMSLAVLRYPELLELVHGLGRESQRRGAAERSPDVQARMLLLEGRLDAVIGGIRSDVAEATAAGGPALAAQLQPVQQRLFDAVARLRTATQQLATAGASPATAQALRDAQLATLADLHGAWRTAGSALDGLLQARVDALYQRLWLHLGTALLLLFAILGTVTFVARQIARPLRALADVTDEVRRTGDHSLRAQWDSRDEIGRLVTGFNGMLAQLDHERELQKELAASARAAGAQRDLVESTPIALVVTSIPDHQVLHANPPAQAWLAGRRLDPWRTGLEPGVRSRFFQQLADRGAVDGFEVRWHAGAEPAWAVLSARRLEFQGQDAVLTAFTPINQLKAMEHRLELWAKVFEASNEGILIVDEQQRILTANRALSRQTGYELDEVLGDGPALLLPDAPPQLWDTAARRGAWQGELTVRRRNGSSYPAWVIVSAVRQSGGAVSHYVLTSIDVSDRKKSEQRIRFLAEHDVLTELPNRSLCMERLRLALQQAARSGQKVAVMFIDLDRFKNINDNLGHHVGDALLKSVAHRLQEAVRAGDTVSRLGGDEFVVVLNGVADADEVGHVVHERLIPLIRQPHATDAGELHVSCSVGIALGPDDADDVDELMRLADTAMYQAKADGKDGARFFRAEMTQQVRQRMRMEADLRRAIDEGQLALHYQPQVDARSGQLLGLEALLRWHHPEQGLVAPGAFVPLAEETGLIVPIGAWVVGEACRQLAAWRAQGHGALSLSVNVSARQLRDDGLLETTRQAIARHGVPAERLDFELTESMVMEDAERNLQRMHALRQLGIGLSIDDFGTGYSSLAYLNRLPIDKLKIDRSFVTGMLAHPTDRAITMAIIGLGHTLGIQVVAEGVESADQVALLRAAGCDVLQGYLLARPMPADEVDGWIARHAAAVGRGDDAAQAPDTSGPTGADAGGALHRASPVVQAG